MKIAGSGSLPGGDYNEEIIISGSGTVNGSASCTEFKISGAGKAGGDLRCSGKFSISGSGKVDGNLQAPEVHVSGSGKVDGAVQTGNCHISGSFHAGSVDCNELHSSGAISTDGDISGEDVVIRGAVRCGGLLNGERIDVECDGGSSADSIGGSFIKIRKKGVVAGFFQKLFGGKNSDCFRVAGSVEGDVIDIEYTTAESVVGREIHIGPGCSIGRVLYTESADISPEAEVGSCEQNIM